jgi:cytoskeletal protein CcmA (bactofilin family)
MIPKKSDGPIQVGGMLGEGVRIEGTLEFTQTFRVDGEFKGKILRSDRLVVGEKGRVSGELEVNALVVYGSVEGKVRVKGALEIHPRGRVVGDVLLATPALTVLEGGVIEGTMAIEKRAEGEVAALPPKQAVR